MKYFNPNPDMKYFKSGKPKGWTKDDSSIRAICAALDITWEEAFKELSSIALKQHDMIHSKNVVNEFLIKNGFKYVTYGKPVVGTHRQTIAEFTKSNVSGTYIAYLSHYYLCIKDGCQYDVQENQKDSVYSYWVKTED